MHWLRLTGLDAQAFAEFYSKAFAAQGLLVLDAAGSEAHGLGRRCCGQPVSARTSSMPPLLDGTQCSKWRAIMRRLLRRSRVCLFCG